MIKILFLIHDLGPGGAEKVLVNLVNHMNREKFDISVTALFGGGVNEQFLRPDVHFRTIWPKAIPGNSHLMKLLTPKQLHRLCVKEHYDIEVSYLEGPSARIISGCEDPDTRKVCWIHIEQKTTKNISRSFRSVKEAVACYNAFQRIICVSKTVKQDFTGLLPLNVPTEVLYNTNDTERIHKLSQECAPGYEFPSNQIKLVSIGKLLPSKGFDRLLRIVKRLKEEDESVHLYILGEGPGKQALMDYIAKNDMENYVDLLGYQTNPYQYEAKCDLYVCASHAEGFSTAATEALILGIPVCTVEVSGMREMLGENNEYGIVTENDDNALYEGIKNLLTDRLRLEDYHNRAVCRGKMFSTERTVDAVETMFLSLGD